MSDKKSESKILKFIFWALTSPVTFILLSLLVYYSVQAYVFNYDAEFNKTMMEVVVGVWILWLIFKNLIKFLLILFIVGSLFLSYYRYDDNHKTNYKEEIETLWEEYFK